jgi:hypothetical protein
MSAHDDVTIDITGNGWHQARCRREGCEWTAPVQPLRADADHDRLVHQMGHILEDLAPKVRRLP